jgi:ribosomal protein S18 acetylase RimI-like enzyme
VQRKPFCSLKNKKDISQHFLSAINRLLKQLSSDVRPLLMRELLLILKRSHILLVRIRGKKKNDPRLIIGMGCLVEIHTPSGRSGRIEDVVVDEQYRGRGLGERLIKELIRRAKDRGCRYVELTSRPQRKTANLLYQRLEFQRRETNVYRLPLL